MNNPLKEKSYFWKQLTSDGSFKEPEDVGHYDSISLNDPRRFYDIGAAEAQLCLFYKKFPPKTPLKLILVEIYTIPVNN